MTPSWGAGRCRGHAEGSGTGGDRCDTYDATFAGREWMESPSHRRNMRSRDGREVGIGAIFFGRAHGEFGGRPVTIGTADFGARD